MGYLLPIQNIQSQQYANRMNLDPYNFAYIGRVQRVKLNSQFFEEFKEQSQSQDEGKDKEQVPFVPSANLYKAMYHRIQQISHRQLPMQLAKG